MEAVRLALLFFALTATWSHLDCLGQHVSSSLHQQSGGRKVSFVDRGGPCHSSLVSGTGVFFVGAASSGQAEYSGRPLESQDRHHSDGVDASTRVAGSSLDSMGKTVYRPLCNEVQQPPSSVCDSCGGHKSLGCRCVGSLLEKPRRVRFSTVGTLSQSAPESSFGQTSAYPGGSLVVGTALVPSSSRAGVSSTSRPAGHKGGSVSTPVSTQSHHPLHPTASHLAAVRGSLQSAGMFSGAISLISDVHRNSTKSVYDIHWRRWCHAKNINPLAPSEADLVNIWRS
jgi:hypothetical protein